MVRLEEFSMYSARPGKTSALIILENICRLFLVHEFLVLIIFPTLESRRKDAETATMELKESTNRLYLSDSIENVEK